MAESGAVLPVDSTGKALRTNTQTTGFTSGQGGVVHQQVVALGDPTTAARLATVSADGELLVSGSGREYTPTVAAFTANGTFGPVDVAGTSGLLVSASGTYGGAALPTLTFQGSDDGGTTWQAVAVMERGTSATVDTAWTLTANLTRHVHVPTGGLTHVRVVLTGWTTPTGTLTLRGTPVYAPLGVVQAGLRLPTLTKGVQGSAGFAVQRLQDAGRTAFSAYNATAHAMATTEGLVSLTPNRGGTTATAATSTAVTTGKTLRIMGVTVTLNAPTTNTAVNARVVLRMSATGAVTTTSPPIGNTSIPPTAATANVPQQGVQFTYADGFELSGTQQFGVSAYGTVAGGQLWVVVYGYEY